MGYITGLDAIDYADRNGLALNKYADPTEPAREGLSVDEAHDVALEDPSLIWLDLTQPYQAATARHLVRGVLYGIALSLIMGAFVVAAIWCC